VGELSKKKKRTLPFKAINAGVKGRAAGKCKDHAKKIESVE